MLKRAGLADDLLLTYDGPDLLANGTLPDVTAVIDFSPGEAKKSFEMLERFRPGSPRMAGEYWAGWFDQWGGKHAATDAKQQGDELAWMLKQGYSVNVYLVHGGTSFGFMNGANFQGGPADHYAPQTTSYDYDAALDEAGRPTPKFTRFRDIIAKATGVTPPPLPSSPSCASFPPSPWVNPPRCGTTCPRRRPPIFPSPWKPTASPTVTRFTGPRYAAPSTVRSTSAMSATTRPSISTASRAGPSSAG